MEERDLGALIENGLKDLAGRIDESRTEARQHFEQLEGEIRQTRTQLEGKIHQLDDKIHTLDGKVHTLDDRVQKLDDRVHTLDDRVQKLDDKIHIQLEYVRGDIRLVAEGVANVDEKLDRHIGETAREFEEVRSLTRLSYVQLEKRVSVLESRSTIS
jgi:predicted nuclease with TOPRIM domain